MKKLIYLLLCTLMLSITGCSRVRNYGRKVVDVDSTMIAKKVEAIVNPSFINVADLYQFQQRIIFDKSQDEIFLKMDQPTLLNVATVCLNRDGKVSKKSVVEEFVTNKDVYENLLPPNNNSNEEQTNIQPSKEELDKEKGGPEYGPLRVETVSKDTVIDNDQYIILKKVK